MLPFILPCIFGIYQGYIKPSPHGVDPNLKHGYLKSGVYMRQPKHKQANRTEKHETLPKRRLPGFGPGTHDLLIQSPCNLAIMQSCITVMEIYYSPAVFKALKTALLLECTICDHKYHFYYHNCNLQVLSNHVV